MYFDCHGVSDASIRHLDALDQKRHGGLLVAISKRPNFFAAPLFGNFSVICRVIFDASGSMAVPMLSDSVRPTSRNPVAVMTACATRPIKANSVLTGSDGALACRARKTVVAFKAILSRYETNKSRSFGQVALQLPRHSSIELTSTGLELYCVVRR